MRSASSRILHYIFGAVFIFIQASWSYRYDINSVFVRIHCSAIKIYGLTYKIYYEMRLECFLLMHGSILSSFLKLILCFDGMFFWRFLSNDCFAWNVPSWGCELDAQWTWRDYFFIPKKFWIRSWIRSKDVLAGEYQIAYFHSRWQFPSTWNSSRRRMTLPPVFPR